MPLICGSAPGGDATLSAAPDAAEVFGTKVETLGATVKALELAARLLLIDNPFNVRTFNEYDLSGAVRRANS
jgi:hypothetical protein